MGVGRVCVTRRRGAMQGETGRAGHGGPGVGDPPGEAHLAPAASTRLVPTLDIPRGKKQLTKPRKVASVSLSNLEFIQRCLCTCGLDHCYRALV